MIITSMVTGKKYDPNKMVRIINLIQAQKYIDNDAVVYDVYISQGKVVFLFSRNETKELYDKWCNYNL